MLLLVLALVLMLGPLPVQAVAVHRAGCRGLILPSASVWQLSLETWAADPPVCQEVKDAWPHARRALLFKPVGNVAELVAFFFPRLAPLTVPRREGVSRRGRRAQAAPAREAEEVGSIVCVGVPLWGKGALKQDDEGSPRLATVEACLVKGAIEPVSTPTR